MQRKGNGCNPGCSRRYLSGRQLSQNNASAILFSEQFSLHAVIQLSAIGYSDGEE